MDSSLDGLLMSVGVVSRENEAGGAAHVEVRCVFGLLRIGLEKEDDEQQDCQFSHGVYRISNNYNVCLLIHILAIIAGTALEAQTNRQAQRRSVEAHLVSIILGKFAV